MARGADDESAELREFLRNLKGSHAVRAFPQDAAREIKEAKAIANETKEKTSSCKRA